MCQNTIMQSWDGEPRGVPRGKVNNGIQYATRQGYNMCIT